MGLLPGHPGHGRGGGDADGRDAAGDAGGGAVRLGLQHLPASVTELALLSGPVSSNGRDGIITFESNGLLLGMGPSARSRRGLGHHFTVADDDAAHGGIGAGRLRPIQKLWHERAAKRHY